MTTAPANRPTVEQRAELRDAQRIAGIPSGIKYDAGTGDGSAYYLAENALGQLIAVGFKGRATKAAFRYRFPTEQQRDAYCARWIVELQEAAKRREAFAAEMRKAHTLKVGDVLYTSWGYDQTNVEFFEVVGVRSSVVDIRELKQERKESSIGMQGTCMPRRGEYAGESYRGKRPNGNNAIRLESFRSAFPWDGRSLSWSSYA